MSKGRSLEFQREFHQQFLAVLRRRVTRWEPTSILMLGETLHLEEIGTSLRFHNQTVRRCTPYIDVVVSEVGSVVRLTWIEPESTSPYNKLLRITAIVLVPLMFVFSGFHFEPLLPAIFVAGIVVAATSVTEHQIIDASRLVDAYVERCY